MKMIREAAREIPLAYECEVLVAGGGPAGAMAAIAAARGGADTLLIEKAGCAGGIWTSGLLSWMLDVTNKGGILREIFDRIQKAGEGYFARKGNFMTFPETLKNLLDEMLAEAGVRILYYTAVAGAIVEDGHLQYALLESKAGRQAAKAQIFIDATGDGDLSAYAGCRFAMGEEGTGLTQPASLIALMTGVQEEAAHDYNNTLPYRPNMENAKQMLMKEMNRAGITPSYSLAGFFHIQEDIWLLMTNHIYEMNPLDPADLTRAVMESRAELLRQQKALRSLGGIWKNMRIVATAPALGVREGRRIQGKYTVTLEDAIQGKKHPNAACHVEYLLDVHPLKAGRGAYEEMKGIKTKPYDIPMEALEAADVDNLLLAGRLISGDFYAHSSYRVSGDAAAIGESAGTEAARRIRASHGKGNI